MMRLACRVAVLPFAAAAWSANFDHDNLARGDFLVLKLMHNFSYYFTVDVTCGL